MDKDSNSSDFHWILTRMKSFSSENWSKSTEYNKDHIFYLFKTYDEFVTGTKFKLIQLF